MDLLLLKILDFYIEVEIEFGKMVLWNFKVRVMLVIVFWSIFLFYLI